MTILFETSDLDTAAAVLGEQYCTMRLASDDGRSTLRVAQDDLGRARLDRVELHMRGEVTAEPLVRVCIVRVRAGRIAYRRAGQDVPCGPGDVVLVAQPDQPWSANLHDLELDVAFLDRHLLADVAQVEDQPVQLLDHRPVSAAASANWWRTYQTLRRLIDDPTFVATPLVTAQAAALLAATALATFPNSASTAPSPADRRDAHPHALRRAIAFIEAHPDRPLTVVDVARAAFVTPRALQLAFRRHLDTTPMAYLRRVRLDRVHADLLAASPHDGVRITDVAARWGFGSVGFSARYRDAFGELPSQTLNR